MLENMSEGKKVNHRIEWIDTLKGILAVLVVLSHCITPNIYGFFFLPFFLTGFFFVSGYTIRPHKGYIQKQIFHTIKILTVAIGINILYSIIVNRSILSADQILGAYFQCFSFYPKYPPIIWFVPCICMAKCWFSLLIKVQGPHGGW